MRSSFSRGASLFTLAAALLLLLSACERPGVDTVQRGYRGTGMELVYNKARLADEAELNAVPPISAPARVRANSPIAGKVYQNVKVLGDLSIAEFGRTMDAMTQWVSPKESCAYCHVEGNFASDDKYTKIVARRMIQMTQHINADWKSHVGATGVTCYTCHRGNALPAERWFKPTEPLHNTTVLGDRAGQNAPSRTVGLSSLPSDPFTAYLQKIEGSNDIRVAGTQALPYGNRHSIKQAEFTYGLMMHMSKSLGVNCTFCHNTRAFSSWEESSPQRATAWYGIRLARDLNTTYLESLTTTFPEFPAGRLGPLKDVAKVNCATCHRGAYKPLYGAPMAQHFPALLGPRPLPVEAAEGAASAAEAAAAGAASAAQPGAAAPAAAEAPASAPRPAG
jgi:photosynthetic reaction center cytochrome c subunit